MPFPVIFVKGGRIQTPKDAAMKGSDIIWKPSRKYIEGSRIKGFMDTWGMRTYKELYRASVEDITWFWPAAMDYLGVRWHRRYDTVLDPVSYTHLRAHET